MISSPTVVPAYAAHWHNRLAVSGQFDREDWCRFRRRKSDDAGPPAFYAMITAPLVSQGDCPGPGRMHLSAPGVRMGTRCAATRQTSPGVPQWRKLSPSAEHGSSWVRRKVCDPRYWGARRRPLPLDRYSVRGDWSGGGGVHWGACGGTITRGEGACGLFRGQRERSLDGR